MSTKLTKEEFTAKYLKEGIPYQNLIRKRLLALGVKENKCDNCGITEWLGSPIQIQVHHINGNRNDNRLENLQMLCPNCHAQTENFQRKNTHVYEPKDKVCINCGKVFIARGDYQRFCSSECSRNYNYMHQREYKSPYSKEFMLELCQKYNTLDEIGFVIHKTRDTVKRNLIQHGLFEDFIRKRDSKNTPVLQYNADGTFIKEWPGITDAQNTLNIHHIGLVCKGKRKSAGGFIWKYKDCSSAFSNIQENTNIEHSSPVTSTILQYDLSGSFIKEFGTVEEASETTNTNRTSIVLCMQDKCKQANNYVWRYKDGEIIQNIDVGDIDYVSRTPVLMYNIQGEVLAEFQSIKEAAKSTGIGYSNICQCLRGDTQSAGGYVWRYKDYTKKPLSPDITNRPIPDKLFQSKVRVLQYTLGGRFIKEHESVAEASRATNTLGSTIQKCIDGKCDRAGSFIWKRKEQNAIPLLIPPYTPRPKRAKAILQYDKHGNLVKEFQTMEEVLKVYDISRGTLMKCLSNEKKSYKGFVWRSKEDSTPQTIDVSEVVFDSKWSAPVVKCDLLGNVLEEYPSVLAASKETGISRTHINNSISGHCRQIDNYVWKYKQY